MRRKPYTWRGIRRLRCFRCGGPARTQWNICSDRNQFRPLCVDCDVELNRMVLTWVRHPDADNLSTEYANRMEAERP